MVHRPHINLITSNCRVTGLGGFSPLGVIVCLPWADFLKVISSQEFRTQSYDFDLQRTGSLARFDKKYFILL
jgi:hypothetical protein